VSGESIELWTSLVKQYENNMTTFRKTITDKRLEDLSDKVRMGTPVSMGEALEVIEYQQMLKKYKPTLKDRIINFFKIK
jgi:hypothetical protein